MKSFIVFCLIFFKTDVFAQDITETETFVSNITETLFNNTSNITHFFDDSNGDDGFDNEEEEAAEDMEESDDIHVSDTIPSKVSAKQGLDESISKFVESGINFLKDTRQTFHKEINDSNSDNEAKDIWIAYSTSWGIVFDALIQDLTPRLLSMDEFGDVSLDISLDCLSTLIEVVSGLRQKKDWAVKLLDSSGRPFAAGSLDGTITSLGAYDQCLSIEKEEDPNDSSSIGFIGQYCIVKYKLALPKKPKKLTLRSEVFNFSNTPVDGTFLEEFSNSAHAFYERFGRTGICIPSQCSKSDFQSILKSIITESHLKLTLNDCHTRHLPQLSSLQMAIISIFVTIFCLMVLATSLDLIIVYTKDLDRIRFIRVESRIKKLLLATLLSFSVYKNGTSLFSTTTPSGQRSIECINGIRVLSMVWILWTHTYLIPIKETFTFVKEFMFTVEELSFQLILNGWVLVDTFFLVGAMLTTYTNFQRLAKNGQINIPQQILNRFFRFWPSLTMTVMLMFIIPSMASGPLWNEYFEIQLSKCTKNWWTTLSFINNWFDESQMCLLHTWYLSADIQLFIIALFLIIPLYKKPSLGIKLIIMAAAASALAIAIRTYLLKQNPTVLYNTPDERDVFDQASTIYVNTYIHLGPYCVGLLLGYAVFKYRTLEINPFLNLLIWLLALFSCLFIMLSTYTLNRGVIWQSVSAALYAGLHRTAWSMCVAWIIFGCSTGNGGPINTFLSWSFFAPLGRLSFMIYLMHFLVIWVRYAYIRQPLPFSHYSMFCEFIVNLMISICVSMVTHLAIEAPLLSLYRIYLSNVFKFSNIRLNRRKDIDKQVNDSGIVVTSKL